MRKIAKNNYQDRQKKKSARADMAEMCFVDDRKKKNKIKNTICAKPSAWQE